jgi:Domain of unknown function (DUF4280)
MAAKHMVCHGAICMCNFGATPDKLVIQTHDREFINDKEGSKKYLASDKDIGTSVFEKNTFGPCQKQPLPGGGFKPCQPVVQEWSGFYKNVTLSNKGKVLLEDSKATCPIGGPDCIKITFHGQVNQPAPSHAKKANPDVMTALNPVVNMNDFEEDNKPYYT